MRVRVCKWAMVCLYKNSYMLSVCVCKFMLLSTCANMDVCVCVCKYV